MQYLNKLVLAAALAMTSFSGSLLADSFTFSYLFSDSQGAPGSFSGTLTGIRAGDFVTVSSVDTLVVNGFSASVPIFTASYDSVLGDFTGTGSAVVSFTKELNNFIFINSDYGRVDADGNPDPDATGDTYAWLSIDTGGFAQHGSGSDASVSFDAGDGVWTLTVPDGGTTVGLLGLALIGFAAVRRQQAAR